MPNPKHHVDSNYTYVRGYVRRKKTTQPNTIDPQIFIYLLLASIIAGVCYFFYVNWELLLIIIIIVSSVLGWRIYRKYKRRKLLSQYYTMSRTCPNCNKSTIAVYRKGTQAHNTPQWCEYCGCKYQ